MKSLILAGGKGVRLWPLSREEKPKQFQCLISQKTMLQETVKRLLPEFMWNDIFISTNKQYINEVKRELPKLKQKNIISEPMARERIAAILLFLSFLPKKFYKQPLLVLPSDHAIKNISLFKKTILEGEKFITEHSDYILTLGAKPTFPDTGLGYIKKGKIIAKSSFEVREVDCFVEKPNLERAARFLKQGNYLWNTAIYFFTPELILKQIEKFIPDNHARYLNIKKAASRPNFNDILEEQYAGMDKIPLEFSILENYKKVAFMELDMGWSDVGSWSVLKNVLSNGAENYVKGNHIDIDSENVMVYGSFDKLVATVNVKDLIIVLTDDIVLVCDKNNSQKVRHLIEKLKREKKFDYL